jgi:curli biogenesis system outer membrane secretion channel CsgG
MILATLVLFFFQAAPAPQPAHQSAASTPTVIKQDSTPPEMKLVHIKKIYVDSFGDDPISKEVQAFVITDLTDSNRFTVTENKEKADAILRGAGLEKTSQEFHAHGEGTAVAGAAGSHSGSVDGSWDAYGGSVHGSSSGGFAAHSAAISDSSASTETINDARISVRLIDQDGDVIWAASEESNNSKYKSATADVADRVVHKLLKKIEVLERQTSNPGTPQADAK